MSLQLFHDRDLSWLTFNYRVLLEADDPNVPILERLRFAAIYSSNLDEFFRVRVANLRRLAVIDKKKINKRIDIDPEAILNQVHLEVGHQLEVYGQTLHKILKDLKSRGLIINYSGKVPKNHLVPLEYYFRTHLMGYLRIQDLKDQKIFLDNKALYFVITAKNSTKPHYFLLNIPSNKVSRFYHIIESEAKSYYYFIDDIIRLNLTEVFPDYDNFESYSIKLNKDADLQIEDEYEGELVLKIEKQIKKRNLGTPSRFLYDASMPNELLQKLTNSLDLHKSDLYAGGRYHNLNDFFQISTPMKGFEYDRLSSISSKSLKQFPSVFKAIEEKDQVLHFPYQSYDYILHFFNKAAIHPDVKSINVTFYRMAQKSMIAEALISAAINGKEVNVFMEVKARFDEENNLIWARKMEAVGIHIHYSIPGLKVHAKAALITMKLPGKKVNYLGFYGTGNLNEGTAKIYCDHSLLTANPEMNKELKAVFDFLLDKKKPSAFKHLIVSQFGAPDRFAALIDREIENREKGNEGKIIIKLNNLEESRLIRKLYEAAEKGVKVILVVRSICCLKPNSDIKVIRIVDRFLEHARIFYFFNSGKEDLFMGSSDWMSRNLYRRVEVTFPIYDPEIKSQLKQILDLQMKDNTKAMTLDENLNNVKIASSGKQTVAQRDIYAFIKKLNK